MFQNKTHFNAKRDMFYLNFIAHILAQVFLCGIPYDWQQYTSLPPSVVVVSRDLVTSLQWIAENLFEGFPEFWIEYCIDERVKKAVYIA